MTTDPAAALRASGLRVTSPRLAVLDVLTARPHIDADTIAAAVREKLGTVSHQTIYDVLHALDAADIVRRLDPSGATSARYEMQVHDNHHHLMCRSCDAVVDVACAAGQAPCLHPADTAGFTVDEAEVIFWGLCPSCQQSDINSITHQERP